MLQNERIRLICGGLKWFVLGGRFEEKVTEWLDCHLRESSHQSGSAGLVGLAVADVGVNHGVGDVLVSRLALDGVDVGVLFGHDGT